MTCKECKFGELTKDIFTGKYFYLCTNECEIPFGGFGDMQIPSSKVVIDCPFGEKEFAKQCGVSFLHQDSITKSDTEI